MPDADRTCCEVPLHSPGGIVKFTIALTAALLLALNALAQESLPSPPRNPCAPWDSLKAGLKAEFGEVPTRIGKGQNDAYVVLFEGPNSMTLVVVLPDEMACFVGAAREWMAFPKQPEGKGA